jgi:3-oxoacyl-[acyl-carrier protein] reductase
MDLGLKNKNVLVTGSSRGLGFATALLLAHEGARVAINGRDQNKLQSAADKIKGKTGVEPLIIQGDVAQPDFPKFLIEQVVGNLGGIDILVTNAGGPPSGNFESFSDSDWTKAIELTFISHVRLIRYALPFLKKSNSASVLTITSYSVKQPIPNLVLSNSIRAATVGLTKSMALEMAKDGIRFNSILPAWTDTDRVQELMAARAKMNQTSIQEEIQKQAKDSPMGRMASPEEFARAAVFLVSPAASYITGVMLSIDGGMYKGLF